MNETLKKLLGTVAPTLATMLGGPLAGTAVAAITAAFGLAPNASANEITSVIQNGGITPDILAKIREQDQKHAEIVAQQGIDLEKINNDFVSAQETTAAGDRADARKMQIAKPSPIPAVLSIIVTLGFFGILIAMMFGVKVSDNNPMMLMLGSLGTAWATIMAYWFGTTRNSDRKTELLAQSSPVK